MKIIAPLLLIISFTFSSCQRSVFQGRIAFSSFEGGESRIVIIDPNTLKLEKLNDSSFFKLGSNVSPDGKQLATTIKGNVFVIDLASGFRKQLTENTNAYFPQWSPNGDRIAFSSRSESYTDLCVVDVNGDNYKRLTHQHTTENMSSDWMPDGKEIIFQSRGYDLFKINLDNPTNVEQITHTGLEGEDVKHPITRKFISVSPNGKHVAYSSEFMDTIKKSGIYIIEVDGGNEQMVFEAEGRPFKDWSIDSKYLVCDLYRNKRWDIFIINLKGEIIKNISEELYDKNASPTWISGN